MKKIAFNPLHCSAMLAATVLLAACTLHEEPTLTASGETGIDPTQVTLQATLNMNITLPERSGAATRVATDEYLHRFIIEAYLDRQPVTRQVVYENVTDRTHLSLPVNVSLHARDYRLVVWADYVDSETPAEDLYYNTESFVPVIPNSSSYVGNTEYKDVFTASVSLDLTGYSDQWGVTVPLEIDLQRPVSRYQLIATDVRSFLQQMASGEVGDGQFTARIKYSSYLPVGYNAYDGVPRYSLLYMQYNTTFSLPEEDTTELMLGFDYVFVEADETTLVPMEVEIVDSSSTTIANTVLRVPCEQGKNTTVRYGFLTNLDSEGGVVIDPGYDGEINIDLGDI